MKLDDPNNVVILRSKDPDICPVRYLQSYFEAASNGGVNLAQGYIFRARDIKTQEISDKPVSSSLMTDRLRIHLKAMNLYAGETSHSGRRGLAITLRMLGLNDNSICSHIGWESKGMLDHYARIGNLIGQNSVASKLADAAEVKNNSSQLFQVSEKTINVANMSRFYFN